jgi:DNA-binding FadR family transcriptional regulator
VRKRVFDSVLASIESGEWPPGSKLPPERELAIQLDSGRTTLRTVLLELTAHGLITARQGSGHYVAATADDVAAVIQRIQAMKGPAS